MSAAIKIRQMLPRCLIVLFSGQAKVVDLLKKARERGHEFEILAKPIKPESLLAVISRKNSIFCKNSTVQESPYGGRLFDGIQWVD